MAVLTYEQIINELQKKIYRPVYFLMGEEPFFIDDISNFIEENVLNQAEKSFNLTVVYGKDVDLPSIVSLAKRYPMMSNYQVLIVKEAQNIKNIDASEIGKKNNPLIQYLQDPLKSTILVILYKGKKLEKNKKLYKAIDDKGIIFESKKIYEDKIPTWITNQFKKRGKSIEPQAAVFMADFIGNNLAAIINEINKILIFLENEKNITVKHIEKLVGVSKEFNNNELLKAIGKRDITQTNKIVLYFASNSKQYPVQQTITMLFDFFQKTLLYKDIQQQTDQEIASKLGIHPFFLTDYKICSKNFTRNQIIKNIHHIREYDVKAKGVNSTTEPHELLKELVCKIIYEQ
jgi:DNA polymerase-3 subunit delta